MANPAAAPSSLRDADERFAPPFRHRQPRLARLCSSLSLSSFSFQTPPGKRRAYERQSDQLQKQTLVFDKELGMQRAWFLGGLRRLGLLNLTLRIPVLIQGFWMHEHLIKDRIECFATVSLTLTTWEKEILSFNCASLITLQPAAEIRPLASCKRSPGSQN